jgi:hypothetical protein
VYSIKTTMQRLEDVILSDSIIFMSASLRVVLEYVLL